MKRLLLAALCVALIAGAPALATAQSLFDFYGMADLPAAAGGSDA